MGQKIHPRGFRLGAGEDWQARWFSHPQKYAKNLLEDIKIRQFLAEKLKLAGLVEVQIERLIPKTKLILRVTRPGVVIGRGGTGLEELKKSLLPLVSLPEPEKNLQIEVVEVKEPDLAACLVASRIANELERRLPPRRVVSRAMERVMAARASGVKIVLAGRIGGAAIARKARFIQGKVPLGTIRARIDFASVPALIPKRGYVGVKVWISKGEEV